MTLAARKGRELSCGQDSSHNDLRAVFGKARLATARKNVHHDGGALACEKKIEVMASASQEQQKSHT